MVQIWQNNNPGTSLAPCGALPPIIGYDRETDSISDTNTQTSHFLCVGVHF